MKQIERKKKRKQRQDLSAQPPHSLIPHLSQKSVWGEILDLFPFFSLSSLLLPLSPTLPLIVPLTWWKLVRAETRRELKLDTTKSPSSIFRSPTPPFFSWE